MSTKLMRTLPHILANRRITMASLFLILWKSSPLSISYFVKLDFFTISLVVSFVLRLSWKRCESSRKEVLFWFWLQLKLWILNWVGMSFSSCLFLKNNGAIVTPPVFYYVCVFKIVIVLVTYVKHLIVVLINDVYILGHILSWLEAFTI